MKRPTKKPFEEHLIEVRNELVYMLKGLRYGPTEIGYIFNQSKQLIGFVLSQRKKGSRRKGIIRKNK